MKLKFEIEKFENRPVLFSDDKKIANLDKTLENLPKNSIIIIREYHLDDKNRENFAKKVILLAKKHKIMVIVGKNVELAKKIGANGVHFSDFDKLLLKFLRKSAFPKDFIFSFACHNQKSLLFCKKLRPDLTFISPAFATSSHKGQKPMGIKNLAKISFQKERLFYPSRLYALGGINKNNIKSIRKLNFSGFGAIDLFANN